MTLAELRASTLQHVSGKTLTSVYQPVLSIAHRRVVGYEALIRATDAAGVSSSPERLFGSLLDTRARAQLDWQCLIKHLDGFSGTGLKSTWMFLNLEPGTIEWRPDLAFRLHELLKLFELTASNIVVELVEQATDGSRSLVRTVKGLRQLGCLIAIDDFGAGHSNFDRVWDIAPEIIKLDRSLIVRATSELRMRRVVAGMIGLLHETGALVLAEGIERRDQALCALDAGVDLVQGYYFGQPLARPAAAVDNLDGLSLESRGDYTHLRPDQRRLATHVQAMSQAVRLLKSGVGLAHATAHLVGMGEVRRCYLLDAGGVQREMSVEATRPDQRFAPLSDTRGANWSHRDYFRDAVDRPWELQISRPYLSLPDACLCVTLSIAMIIKGIKTVLCCDLDANLAGSPA